MKYCGCLLQHNDVEDQWICDVDELNWLNGGEPCEHFCIVNKEHYCNFHDLPVIQISFNQLAKG